MMTFEEALNARFLLQKEYLGDDKPINRSTPLVSVSVATYQHKNYIRQCLDGILMQKTDFPFEVIIGEDGSVDGTQEICMEYAEKYPDKIRLFIRDRALSQFKDADGTVKRFNGIWNRMSCRGEYIAMCEGDDYWIDPLKLQKQVDILRRCDVSLVYTGFMNVDQNGDVITRKFHDDILKESKSGDMLSKLLRGNFIMTLTVCFKREVILSELYKRVPISMDYSLFLSATEIGDFAFIPACTGAYRRVPTGAIMSRKKEIDDCLCTIYRYFSMKYLDGQLRKRNLKSNFLIKLSIIERAVKLLRNPRHNDCLRSFIRKDKTLLLLLPISILTILIDKFKMLLR